MRKFKVECDFGSGNFNDDDFISYEIVENETADYDEIVAKAEALFTCAITVNEVMEVFDTPLNDKYVTFNSADGFTYGVPVMAIAQKRAYSCAKDFDGDDGLAMINEVLPLFERDEKAIIDYAKTLKWNDIERLGVIRMVRKKKEKPDYQKEWAENAFNVL